MYPRSRTLIHPGPVRPIRIQAMHSRGGRHVRLLLRPGLSLFDALVEPLAQLDISSATATLFGGIFAELHYCTPAANPSGPALATYSEPIRVEHACMVSGTATLGKSMTGAPLVHCHATIRTADGATKGGHLLPESSIVGGPITALATSLDDFNIRQVCDEETSLPLFQPRGKNPDE